MCEMTKSSQRSSTRGARRVTSSAREEIFHQTVSVSHIYLDGLDSETVAGLDKKHSDTSLIVIVFFVT